jgi:hypothetical protein
MASAPWTEPDRPPQLPVGVASLWLGRRRRLPMAGAPSQWPARRLPVAGVTPRGRVVAALWPPHLLWSGRRRPVADRRRLLPVGSLPGERHAAMAGVVRRQIEGAEEDDRGIWVISRSNQR